ncbi:MAG: trigger factor [Syntrophales bacterium]
MNETSQAVKIEEISPVKKKLSFEIPWEETKIVLDDVYRKISKTAKVKGFRPGKIPRPVLEKFYKDHAEEEAITQLFNQHFWDALREHAIDPVSRPEIDQQGIETEKAFAFSATVEIEPVFDPEGYAGLGIDREEVEVTDADMEVKLKELQEMYSTMEEISEDSEVVSGNYVVIDFQGAVDGKPLKELKADDYLLEVGSNTFITGFEDQLLGMKKGEAREVAIKFPADYHHKEVAGKDAIFTVTIKNIKEKQIPEINEEFVKNFEQYSTLKELRDDIRKDIESQKQEQADGSFSMALMEKLIEKNPIVAPESLVERQILSMMEDTRWRMSMQGIDADKAAKILPQYHDLYKNDATRIVQTLLLMKRIGEKENISVSDEELNEHIKALAEKRGQSYESFLASLAKDDMMETIRAELANKKVMDFIKEKAVITMVKKESPATQEEVS